MTAEAQARQFRVVETCNTAKEFVDRFYRELDEERHTVKNMYESSGKIIFNGNGFESQEAIGKFYENLPKSRTRIHGFDAHEIEDQYMGGARGILISVYGAVSYGKRQDSSDSRSLNFFETFLITSQSGSWKILSDNFRFQNSNTDAMLKLDLWNTSMMETS